MGAQERVPNKWDDKYSIWILDNLSSQIYRSNYDDLNIVMVGDSSSDAKVAEHLARNVPNYSNVKFQNLIVNSELSKARSVDGVQFSDSWVNVEQSLDSMLVSDKKTMNVILCDLDRTVIFPRGILDKAYNKIHRNSIISYLDHFFINGIKSHYRFDKLMELFSYVEDIVSSTNIRRKSRNYGDTELELLDILSCVTKMVKRQDIIRADEEERVKLVNLIKICKNRQFGISVIPRTNTYTSMATNLDVKYLLRHLNNQKFMLENGSTSINPLFRSIQERETINYLDNRSSRILNGYIVQCMVKFHRLMSNCVFLCQTDRPARSLGLRISSRTSLYCRDDKVSFYEKRLKLAF